ncbi:CDP-glycerol glycerophosphotransferase family protein [Candidatus Saccharibacteria bacterium]|nr:CDP-glycerol glycerophosphotransferase family protein [Candidatus Saccharibacteria bacterium]
MIFYLIVSIPLRFNKKYDNLWLIGERPDEARDNGYWLYKYIIENHPETNIRFVLAKNSVDYEKMPRKDLIIEPGSAKHYINYILCRYSISTHMHGVCPGKSFVIPFLPFVRRKKTVFLQHGITVNAVNLRGGLDIIVAASNEEKKILESANPKYSGKVYTLGFSRYDNLVDASLVEKQKIILVMPTFRRWLRDIARLKGADQTFMNTEYFKRWNNLLNNKKITKILKQNNVKLIFFPHKEMQALAHNFKAGSKYVVIGKTGQYDIQELLRRSSLLITDYSSVFFDFVYMNKPVIFYQFDRKDFFSKHYTSSGKPYPFGDILDSESELVDKILRTVENDYHIKSKYKKDADEFYAFRDSKNCERNYRAIKASQ